MKYFNKKRVLQSIAVIGALSLGCTATVFGQESRIIKMPPVQKQKQKQIKVITEAEGKAKMNAKAKADNKRTQTISLQCCIDDKGEQIIQLMINGKKIDVDSLDEANAIINKLGMTTNAKNQFVIKSISGEGSDDCALQCEIKCDLNSEGCEIAGMENCEQICAFLLHNSGALTGNQDQKIINKMLGGKNDGEFQIINMSPLSLAKCNSINAENGEDCEEIRIMLNGDGDQTGSKEYKVFKIMEGKEGQAINMAPQELSWTFTENSDKNGDDYNDISEANSLELKGLGTIASTDGGKIKIYQKGNQVIDFSPKASKYDIVTTTNKFDDDDDHANTDAKDNNFTFDVAGFEPPKVMLGVMMDSVPETLQEFLQLDEGEGTMILHVIEGTPADKAGLKAKDIILGIAVPDKDKIESVTSESLRKYLADLNPGDKIRLKINRAGNPKTIKVTLGEWDPQAMNIPAPVAGTEGLEKLYIPQLKGKTENQWIEQPDTDGLQKLHELKGLEYLKGLENLNGIINLEDLENHLQGIIDLDTLKDGEMNIHIISPDEDESDIDFNADDLRNSLKNLDIDVDSNLSEMMKMLDKQMQQIENMMNKLQEQQQDLRKQLHEKKKIDA